MARALTVHLRAAGQHAERSTKRLAKCVAGGCRPAQECVQAATTRHARPMTAPMPAPCSHATQPMVAGALLGVWALVFLSLVFGKAVLAKVTWVTVVRPACFLHLAPT